jgi:hypothetical protein
MLELILKMQAAEGMGLEQIQALLEASDEVEFKAGNKEDLYDWVRSLETEAPPKNREEEAAKAKARAAERFRT